MNILKIPLLAVMVSVFSLFVFPFLGKMGVQTGIEVMAVGEIQISTCSGLQDISNDLTADYELISNIDCTDTATWNGNTGFIPIGTELSPFTGTLNGNGYQISNLFISSSSEEYVGLFGSMLNATVWNLDLVNIDFEYGGGAASYADWVGSFAGYIESSTITDVNVEGNITHIGTQYLDWVGGFAGEITNNSIITSCSTDLAMYFNIQEGSYGIGGFVGELSDGSTILDSTSNVVMTFENIDRTYGTGGFAGIIADVSSVQTSSSTGSLNMESSLGTSQLFATGGFVGNYDGSVGSEISDSSSLVNISIIYNDDVHSLGGFVGDFEQEGIIDHSYSTGSIFVNAPDMQVIGGFVGWFGASSDSVIVKNSYSTSPLTITGDYVVNIGGFIGKGEGGQAEDSYATGDIDITYSSTPAPSYAYESVYTIGGFAGYLYGINTSITRSYATGDITISDYDVIYNVGGFVAGLHSGSSISESTSFGSISIPSGSESGSLGGFVGYFSQHSSVDSFITDSYSRSDIITGTLDTWDSGGFLGYASGSYATLFEVSNSYSTGTVSNAFGDENGFSGEVGENLTVESSYWDVESSGLTESVSGTGYTTAQLKNSANLTDWDFSGTWMIDSNENDGYPILQWQVSLPILSEIFQYKNNGVTTIPLGSNTDESNVMLKMRVSHTQDLQTLTPEVEVRPIGVDFTNSATHTGTEVSYKGLSLTAQVFVSGLTNNTSYHWQARVCDENLECSGWLSYGLNSESSADFTATLYEEELGGVPGLRTEWARFGFADYYFNMDREICVDSVGNSYVIGYFGGDNPISFGYPDHTAIHSVQSGDTDSFIAKYNNAGEFVWAKILSGTAQSFFFDGEYISSCEVDENDNLYIGGYFNGITDLDPSPSEDIYTSAGKGDGFVSKYSPDGSYVRSYIFSSSPGDAYWITDKVEDIFVTSDYLYVTGLYNASNFDIDGTEGVDLRDSQTRGDAFVSKYELSTGNYVGGVTINGVNTGITDNVTPINVVADSNNNVYVFGYSRETSMDYDSSEGIDIKTSETSSNLFVTKFDENLEYGWTRIIMNSKNFVAPSIPASVVDNQGNFYLVGRTGRDAYLLVEGSDIQYSSNGLDGFFIGYSPNGELLFVKMLTEEGTSSSQSFEDIYYHNNKFYLTSFFEGSVDFDLGDGERIYTRSEDDGRYSLLVLDNNLDFLNNMLFEESAAPTFEINSEYLYLLNLPYPYPEFNFSFSYQPNSILYPSEPEGHHLTLAKYKLEPFYFIKNIDEDLNIIDKLFKSTASSYSYLYDENPSIYIETKVERNYQESSSAEVYEDVGTYFNQGDDDYWTLELPFSFPFYDEVYESIILGTNGIICFDSEVDCSWYPDHLYDDSYGPFIMPLAIDTQTDTKEGDGIFVEQSSESVTIVWKGIEYGEDTITSESSVTLYPSGEFDFKYGPHPEEFTYEPVIGVGAGDGIRYTEASNSLMLDYNYASTIHWTTPDKPILIAEADVDTSNDRDFVNIQGDSSPETRKALIKNLGSTPGILNYSMYVPYQEGENISRVVLCPNANNLSEISLNCSGGVSVKVGSTGVSTSSYYDNPYVKISGYSQKSGIASASDHFTISISDTSIKQGEKINISIFAQDSEGNVDPSYTGTVNIQTNIPNIPTQYTFKDTDNGIAVFSDIVISQKGTYTLSVEDVLDEEVLGASDSISVASVSSSTTPPATPTPSTPPVNEQEETVEEEEVVEEEEPTEEENEDITPPTEEPSEEEEEKESLFVTISNGVKELTTNIAKGISNIDIPKDVSESIAVTGIAVVSTHALLTNFVTLAGTQSLSSLQLLSSFFLIGGLKRKKNQKYSVVYDSVSKEPINMATVRVMDEMGKLVTTVVTDVYGVFDLKVPDGKYSFSVVSRNHSFPSQAVLGTTDDPYQNVYKGGLVEYSSNTGLNISIPMDKEEKGFLGVMFSSSRSAFVSILNVLLKVLFVVGFGMTVISLVKEPSILIWLSFGMYILLILLYLLFAYRDRRSFGVVRSTQGNMLEGLEIGVRELEFDTIYAKRVSDEKGKYRFILPGGKYRLEILNSNYELVDTDNDTFEIKDGSLFIVKEDIVVRRKV